MNLDKLQSLATGMVQAVSEFKVLVNYDQVAALISDIKNQTDSFEDYVSKAFSNVVENEKAWSASYQKRFDSHVNNQTKANLIKIIRNIRAYITQLETIMNNYKRIDS